MKSITFVTEDISYKAGVERVLSIIANKLSEEYDVTIISMFNEKNESAFFLNDNIKIIKVFKNIKRDFLRFYKYIYPLLYIFFRLYLLKYRTDDFIIVETRIAPLFSFMNKKSKLIVWEHMNSFVTGDIVGRFFEIGRKKAAKSADKIVVLTNKDKDHYDELYNLDSDKVITIFNPNEKKAVSNEYNIGSKKIISAGRITYIKGFDYLVDVAKIVFSKHPDWSWDIYGTGGYYDDINEKIISNNLKNNVFLKGHEDNLYEKYKDYSFYVLTSRFEGLGMVVIEAQNAKLPVVSFDCPCGPYEMIKNNENGYLIKCFDVEEMSNKINYLIENQKTRLEMSAKSNILMDKFEIDNIIEKWKSIL